MSAKRKYTCTRGTVHLHTGTRSTVQENRAGCEWFQKRPRAARYAYTYTDSRITHHMTARRGEHVYSLYGCGVCVSYYILAISWRSVDITSPPPPYVCVCVCGVSCATRIYVWYGQHTYRRHSHENVFVCVPQSRCAQTFALCACSTRMAVQTVLCKRHYTILSMLFMRNVWQCILIYGCVRICLCVCLAVCM